MTHPPPMLALVGVLFSLTAIAGGGGILGLKSPDGSQGHAVTVESSPDGGGAGEWVIRDNEFGCETVALTITMSGDPLAITACTAPTGSESCCDDLSGWTKGYFRKLREKERSDTDADADADSDADTDADTDADADADDAAPIDAEDAPEATDGD